MMRSVALRRESKPPQNPRRGCRKSPLKGSDQVVVRADASPPPPSFRGRVAEPGIQGSESFGENLLDSGFCPAGQPRNDGGVDANAAIFALASRLCGWSANVLRHPQEGKRKGLGPITGCLPPHLAGRT